MTLDDDVHLLTACIAGLVFYLNLQLLQQIHVLNLLLMVFF